jgi:hypothetical protein
MNLFKTLFDGKSGDAPSDTLTVAIARAKDVLRLDEDDLADGGLKKREDIVGVLNNLQAAKAALRTGVDMEGRRISPREIGIGLSLMLADMRAHGSWFRLHVNASDKARRALDALKEAVEVSAKSMI